MNFQLARAVRTRGMSQNQFSRYAKIPASFFNKIVLGTRRVFTHEARKIADALDMEPEDLFDEITEPRDRWSQNRGNRGPRTGMVGRPKACVTEGQRSVVMVVRGIARSAENPEAVLAGEVLVRAIEDINATYYCTRAKKRLPSPSKDSVYDWKCGNLKPWAELAGVNWPYLRRLFRKYNLIEGGLPA